MADALCGPSNALQNFQKHSTVDRTLQQDRLISRPSPSQGFRSSSSSNAGQLDAELEAFQTGILHDFASHAFAPSLQPLQHTGPASWAADFQRMNISGPSPQFHREPVHPELAQQGSSTAGWHQDFAKQFQPMGAQSANQIGKSTYRFNPMPEMNMGSQFGMAYSGPAQVDMSMAQQQPVEAYDEEAFARAFDEASKSELDTKQDWDQSQGLDMGQDILINESAVRLMSDENREEQTPKLGADLIHDPASQDPRNLEEQDDSDALARTAAQLLDTLKTNTSSKFQNSQFLGLMRQLRDKEAWVDGDRIVGVNGAGEGEEDMLTPGMNETAVHAP